MYIYVYMKHGMAWHGILSIVVQCLADIVYWSWCKNTTANRLRNGDIYVYNILYGGVSFVAVHRKCHIPGEPRDAGETRRSRYAQQAKQIGPCWEQSLTQ